jgi:hypothetical protein
MVHIRVLRRAVVPPNNHISNLCHLFPSAPSNLTDRTIVVETRQRTEILARDFGRVFGKH